MSKTAVRDKIKAVFKRIGKLLKAKFGERIDKGLDAALDDKEAKPAAASTPLPPAPEAVASKPPESVPIPKGETNKTPIKVV